jgi:hypothetical protein
MIRDHYLTLNDEDFKNEIFFPPLIKKKLSDSSANAGELGQEWQGMVKELKAHSEKLIYNANVEMKKSIMKLAIEQSMIMSNLAELTKLMKEKFF